MTKETASDRFLGDGTPGPEGDARVRCWFCAHYTHNLQLPLWVHDKTGATVKIWIDCRTCSKGEGHDPFILRHCPYFKPLAPQYRIRLPDEAFQRGWRDDYGTDDDMIGGKLTRACAGS